jgi:hypothetical protein
MLGWLLQWDVGVCRWHLCTPFQHGYAATHEAAAEEKAGWHQAPLMVQCHLLRALPLQ